ncbi:unnamed protein product [Gadus morhua 'NCC']
MTAETKKALWSFLPRDRLGGGGGGTGPNGGGGGGGVLGPVGGGAPGCRVPLKRSHPDHMDPELAANHRARCPAAVPLDRRGGTDGGGTDGGILTGGTGEVYITIIIVFYYCSSLE